MTDTTLQAYTEIQKRVQLVQAIEPNLTPGEAMTHVMQEDPTLWTAYQFEMTHGRSAPIIEKRAPITYEDVLKSVKLQKARMSPDATMKEAWGQVLTIFDPQRYPEFYKAYQAYFTNGDMVRDYHQ